MASESASSSEIENVIYDVILYMIEAVTTHLVYILSSQLQRQEKSIFLGVAANGSSSLPHLIYFATGLDLYSSLISSPLLMPMHLAPIRGLFVLVQHSSLGTLMYNCVSGTHSSLLY